VVPVAKVLILTGDAGESLGFMYPYQRLIEEGYEVDVAGPTKKKLQWSCPEITRTVEQARW
jgi:protease I